MNTAVLGLIVILAAKTDCFSPTKQGSVLQEEADHGVFLRKLHSTIRSGSEEEAKSLSWSEILADILVTKIGLSKILPKPNETQQDENNATQENVLTKLCSLLLNAYKHFIYDKFFQRSQAEDMPGTSTSKNEVTEMNIELQEIEPNTDLNDFEVITINPEVEIIDPEYHGKLCSECDSENVARKEVTTPKSDCPQGLVRDLNANCVDPKSLNYIISIPYQCPIGYRLNWSGYCRPIF